MAICKVGTIDLRRFLSVESAFLEDSIHRVKDVFKNGEVLKAKQDK